ncbi:MAG: alpha/beta hydrolase [SAR324 cluster bacterium]|nr:alpha/beta hydrolase [SAR324 cluster bacterium]
MFREVIRYENFPSKFIEARHVDVWLPPGYEQSPSKRFPVIYMHDGQNLFDPHLSFIGVAWGVDQMMVKLINEQKIREAIVVGVWNTENRFAEYMPQKVVTGTNMKLHVEDSPVLLCDQIISDNYLKFLVDELKPFMDTTHKTLLGPQDTFIMGSSMGGLISAYAVCEYPAIFGGAGCLSTHWPAGNGMVIEYLRNHLPDPGTHRFYFDYGTETLDADYEPYQKKMDEVVRNAGYIEGKSFVTKKFDGAEHSERAWSERVDQPLIFFLEK